MRAATALAVALLVIPAAGRAELTEHGSACAQGDGEWIRKVCFSAAFDPAQYGHAVLGDTPEWTALTVFKGPAARLAADGNQSATDIVAGADRIFEDVAPRLADLDGDGRPEIIVVQSSFRHGARLVVYAIRPEPQMLAATPFIGQPNRWLAPAGIADFDGDGQVEIAYVDRPHLVGDLVFVRLDGTRLVKTARIPGLTNHRIGDDFISGGVRDCGQGAELILASKDWTRIIGVRDGQAIDLGPLPATGLTLPPC
jgi:hypothetical protein